MSVLSQSRDGCLVCVQNFAETVYGSAQIANQSVVQAVDPTMYGECLPALPRVSHHGRLAYISHLLDNIEFAESIEALQRVRQCNHRFIVL